jgi:hypothetical protein
MNPSLPESTTAADSQLVSPARGTWRLWVYGIGMALICAGFGWRYPLRDHPEELLDIGKLADYRTLPFVGFVVGVIALFALYLLAFCEARRISPIRGRFVLFVCGAVQVAAMGWMYPVNAIDIYIYSARSRLFTEHGANPMTTPPIAFSRDPYMRFASSEWGTHVSPYGPLWNLIAAPTTYFGGDRILLALAGFKILAGMSALICAWLIAQTVSPTRPTDAVAAGIFFLWNPLILWEGVGNGHNDLVMLVPLLAALLAWTRKKDEFVIPLLVLAATIKYVPIVLIPLAALAIWMRAGTWRARWRVTIWSAVGTLMVLMVAFFPFYDIGAVRDSIDEQGQIFLTSPAAVVLVLVGGRFGEETTKLWLTRIGDAIVLITILWQALRIIRAPAHLPRACYEVLFVFLLVATWNFRGWYVIWLVGVAAMLPFKWPAARTVAWSAGAVLIYGLYIWIWHWWGIDFPTIQNIAVAFMMGPPVILTVIEISRRLWRSAPRPAVVFDRQQTAP